MQQPSPITEADLVTWTVFLGNRQWASGSPQDLAVRIKQEADPAGGGGFSDGPALLIFDDTTGKVVDPDLRGTPEEVFSRYSPAVTDSQESDGAPMALAHGRKPGRPKLGVVAREVTLMPRHWQWLNEQPGGASVVLRKLVEAARREGMETGWKRRATEAAYHFMTVMGGNLAGYEEAIRALYAGDRMIFQSQIQDWPADIRHHAETLATGAFSTPGNGSEATA